MQSKELIFLKPDAIEGKLVGKIIARFEEAGFKIVRMKKNLISKELALLLYPDSKEQLTGMGNKTLTAMSQKGGMEMVTKLFNTTDPFEIGKQLNEWNRKYASSTEVIACILEGEDAANRARALIGKTDPAIADKGTIRGDFSKDSIYQGNMEKRACRNLVHASDAERAPVEIGYFEKYFF
jgi:nucleoside-diphosphate kinase